VETPFNKQSEAGLGLRWLLLSSQSVTYMVGAHGPCLSGLSICLNGVSMLCFGREQTKPQTSEG
jgi:hypothetical protein